VVFAGVGLGATPSRPGYPGHESIGVVEAAPPGSSLSPGTAVLLTPDRSCSRSFAELQALPERFVTEVPSLEPRMVLAQQLGTVIFALKKFWPGGAGPDQVAVVFGAGSAGLFFLQRLVAKGFGKVAVIEPDRRRSRYVEALGGVFAADYAEARNLLRSSTGGRGAALVVEAAGRDESRAQAIDAVGVEGTVGLFGLPERPGYVPLPLGVAMPKRCTIAAVSRAQHEPGLASFCEAIEIVAATPEFDQILGPRYDIEDVGAAFADAHEHVSDGVKVWLDLRTTGSRSQ